MDRFALRVSALVLVVCATAAFQAQELSFEERVNAREAIERVDHRNREGKTRTFERALPREWLETKVREQIARSTLVDELRPGLISREALRLERERIEHDTLFPDRLRELYAALGNDLFLIEESLIRPLLVERAAIRLQADPDDPFVLDADASSATDNDPAESSGFVSGCSVGDDAWNATAVSGAPNGRTASRAVWTGKEMLVWGGGDPVPLDTGGRYDPVLDRWTPISTEGAPSARFGHTLVWTGHEMVVWGGKTALDHVDDGARYDPRLDQWTPVTPVDAPEKRSYHTATWSGTEMIVWGGWNEKSGAFDSPGCLFGRCCGDYLQSGGRYHPATDTWTATSTTGAPPGVNKHAAVWTGEEMIVWSGEYFGGHPLACFEAQNWAATGGRYDPVTDSWNPTSLSGNPQGRRSPSAVWTGDEMIVWGGTADESGRYDPATDTWATVNLTGAPEGRKGSTAVWTGDRMLVWGGAPPLFTNDPFDTGGRYSPRGDTWTETTIMRAPEARSGHVAVWTGTMMLVWGGRNVDDDPLQTGGAYQICNEEKWPPSISSRPQRAAEKPLRGRALSSRHSR